MTTIALFPMTPRAAGRLAARRGAGPADCPHPPAAMGEAAREWMAGWGEGFGIPPTWEARTDMLVERMCELLDALAEIRDTAPPDIREKACRALLSRRPEPVPLMTASV